MKYLIHLLIVILSLNFGCNVPKSKMDKFDFESSVEAVHDSLGIVVNLLDKLSTGHVVFIVNEQWVQLYADKIAPVVMMDSLVKLSKYENFRPLSQSEAYRFLKLYQFLNKNHVSSFTKRWDGLCFFSYHQDEGNPNSNFYLSRDICYIESPKDTASVYYKDGIILDSYKKMILRAPKEYYPGIVEEHKKEMQK